MNSIMRKPAFCILITKGANQLSGYCAAYKCLRFRYVDSTGPLKFLASSRIFSYYTARFVLETKKIRFPTKQLTYEDSTLNVRKYICYPYDKLSVLITGNSIESL